jgi:hypothetical protein
MGSRSGYVNGTVGWRTGAIVAPGACRLAMTDLSILGCTTVPTGANSAQPKDGRWSRLARRVRPLLDGPGELGRVEQRLSIIAWRWHRGTWPIDGPTTSHTRRVTLDEGVEWRRTGRRDAMVADTVTASS